MGRVIDLKGLAFGRLSVMERVGNIGNAAAWFCKCSCGNEKIIRGSSLRAGAVNSCGCLLEESRASFVEKFSKKLPKITYKGMDYDPTSMTEYRIWAGIRARCNDLTNNNYGGRGISICERWDLSFENFLIDMGLRPSLDLSIDRIDNNGNYEPENCRWATVDEQSNNKRTNVFINYNGVKKTITQWAKLYNLPFNVINARVKLGWSLDKVFNTPYKRVALKNKSKKYLFNNKTQSLKLWSKELKISYWTLKKRLSSGLTTEEAFVK